MTKKIFIQYSYSIVLHFFMSLTLLFSLCQCLDNKCVSPFHTPSPIKGYKLKFAQVLISEGEYAPKLTLGNIIERGHWSCDQDNAVSPNMFISNFNNYRRFKRITEPQIVDFSPNCNAEELTADGQFQQKKLGEEYFEYLFKNGLFTDYPKPSEIFVRSAAEQRNIRSAQAFIHGFVPPGTQNTSLTLMTDEEGSGRSLLKPSIQTCKEITNDDDIIKEYWPSISPIASKYGIEQTYENMIDIARWVISYSCSGRKLPFSVTQEIQDACHKIINKHTYGRFSKKPELFASYLMREFIRIPSNITGIEYKFSLFSGSEESVASIHQLLAGSDANVTMTEHYANHLLMEIWTKGKTEYVRFAYNGQVIKLKEMKGKDIVKLSDFKKSEYKNVHDYCKDLP